MLENMKKALPLASAKAKCMSGLSSRGSETPKSCQTSKLSDCKLIALLC
jgi:hypothetical protein